MANNTQPLRLISLARVLLLVLVLNSMPKRNQAVIAVEGGPTRY